ncbi:uncharacterized protein LOC128041748 [Gossypium raimondii]|uniref:uncharacterized protein LOC128041748 n=1 Tax=Gossypium raimondii TaxID=29730 RepID=UPI00227D50E7|nr:uncharacterized protein LOC128041748 [Gossypium raimondii]
MGHLINCIPANVNFHSDYLLRELITNEGTWNLDLLQVWLPEDLIRHIVGIPPPHPSEGLDRLSWRHTLIGAFSIKSAYKMMKEDSWNSKNEIWKRTWKLTRPQRVRFFFWTVLKKRLLTNAKRVRRGLEVNPSYPIYGHDSEDICILLEIAQQLKKSGNKSYQVINS